MPMALSAIRTRYIGATNTHGSKISATAMMPGYPRIRLEVDHRLSTFQRHAAAARAYAVKLEWEGRWVMGECDNGYVAIRLPAGEVHTSYDFRVWFVTAYKRADVYEFRDADADTVHAVLGARTMTTKHEGRIGLDQCFVQASAWLDATVDLIHAGINVRVTT
jgi:hypothetical protein